MFPVRCYSCNAVLAHRHPEYARLLREGAAARAALDAIRVERMCCRRMFLGHVDLFHEQLEYANVDVTLDDGGTVLRRRSAATHEVSCD